MKFDQLFPDVKPEEMFSDYWSDEKLEGLRARESEMTTREFQEGNYLKSETSSPCCICKEPTSWIEINFQGNLCSEECDKKMWDGYFEAEKRCQERERNSKPEEDF